MKIYNYQLKDYVASFTTHSIQRWQERFKHKAKKDIWHTKQDMLKTLMFNIDKGMVFQDNQDDYIKYVRVGLKSAFVMRLEPSTMHMTCVSFVDYHSWFDFLSAKVA